MVFSIDWSLIRVETVGHEDDLRVLGVRQALERFEDPIAVLQHGLFSVVAVQKVKAQIDDQKGELHRDVYVSSEFEVVISCRFSFDVVTPIDMNCD